jgi:hypothetical protein
MPPKANAAHLAKGRPRNFKNQTLITIAASVFALAILIAGIGYSQGAALFLTAGLHPIPEAKFYATQRLLASKIIAFAENITRTNRQMMNNNSIICIDGSWNHRRNGDFHIIDVIDYRTKKIVDFEILFKSSPFRKGNYVGSSNGMETEGMRRIIQRWKNDSRVSIIVHDKDAKITKLIRDSGWNVLQNIDANHARKSFQRFYDNNLTREEKAHLYGLKERIDRWLNHVIHLDIPLVLKLEVWMNAKSHFRGDHSNCTHLPSDDHEWMNKDNPESLRILDKILEKGRSIISSTNFHNGSTQLNEAFHQVKAKYANKRISYLTSTDLRFAMAIISFDNAPHWQKDLREFCGVPSLPDEIETLITEDNLRKSRIRENRQTPEFREKANSEKCRRRSQHKSQTKGSQNYKPLVKRKRTKRT